MKGLTIISFLLFFSFYSYGQEDAISKYFNKYSDDERFTSIYISNRMFSMFSSVEENEKEDKELKEILSKLGGLRILSSDNSEGKKLYQEAHKLLVTKGFEELMVIKEKGSSELKFLIKEVNGKVRELLMLSGGEGKFFLLSIVGDIDLKKISKLSKNINVEGMKNLDKLKEDKNSKNNNSK